MPLLIVGRQFSCLVSQTGCCIWPDLAADVCLGHYSTEVSLHVYNKVHVVARVRAYAAFEDSARVCQSAAVTLPGCQLAEVLTVLLCFICMCITDPRRRAEKKGIAYDSLQLWVERCGGICVAASFTCHGLRRQRTGAHLQASLWKAGVSIRRGQLLPHTCMCSSSGAPVISALVPLGKHAMCICMC